MGDYVNESAFPPAAASERSLHRWIDIPPARQSSEGLQG